ncbi:MAG: hypothetical protein U1F98_01280 [Verrucomicrobiota bacterium]
MENKRWREPRTWVELFAFFNLAGLAPDILLAHSTNRFHAPAEWVPLVYSAACPLLLAPALWSLMKGRPAAWRVLGNVAGWIAIAIGVAGLVLHLKSQFFEQRTLASLVYAAPFAAPLAYTGIGLLLLLNRSIEAGTREWSEWVVFLALGGFVGNFIFSVTDHAQNGLYRELEWIPVIASALGVGFLVTPLLVRVGDAYLKLCFAMLALQAVVGVAGFVLHLEADLRGHGRNLFETIVHGAPVFAPMLFPDLALLAGIGLWTLGGVGARNLTIAATEGGGPQSDDCGYGGVSGGASGRAWGGRPGSR